MACTSKAIVVEKFGLDLPEPDLSEWDRVVEAQLNPENEVTIGMVGKYIELVDAYKSLNEALIHAGISNRAKVNILYLDAEDIERDGTGVLESLDAIWCQVVLVTGVRKARLPRSVMPVRTRCHIWVSAWACSWR